jgi:hypothetical protein
MGCVYPLYNPRISKYIQHLAYITLNPMLHTFGPDLAITAAIAHGPQPILMPTMVLTTLISSRDEESKVKGALARRRHD